MSPLSKTEISRASARAFTDLDAAGLGPSVNVATAAAELLLANRVNHDPRSALVYDVAGGSPYVVVLRLDEHGRIRREISFCTCEAGRAKRTCYHLVGALIDAYDQGFELSREMVVRGPYIMTVTRLLRGCRSYAPASDVATWSVTTLEEADLLPLVQSDSDPQLAVGHLMRAPGKIRRWMLPDGSTVQVESRSEDSMIAELAAAGVTHGPADDVTEAVVSAWNSVFSARHA